MHLMSHPHLRKIALIAGGIAVSVVLTLAVENLAQMHTPGVFVVGKLFPPSPDANIVVLGFVWLGVDFLLCFAVLSGAYLLFTKLCKWEDK